MPDAQPCPTCGGYGYLRVSRLTTDPLFGQLEPCDTCGVVALRILARMDHVSALRGRALTQFFTNFNLDGPAAPARPAFNAALLFAREPRGWLVIHGPKGSGKSHLAAAIANHLYAQRAPFLYTDVPDLLSASRLEVGASKRGEFLPSRLLDDVKKLRVLLLDDLGAERWTEWAEERLFLLFNYRYREMLPTVVITNVDPHTLPGRISSRLGERGFSQVVLNLAPDYRLQDGTVTP
jgi:DNA replication protein DnaC